MAGALTDPADSSNELACGTSGGVFRHGCLAPDLTVLPTCVCAVRGSIFSNLLSRAGGWLAAGRGHRNTLCLCGGHGSGDQVEIRHSDSAPTLLCFVPFALFVVKTITTLRVYAKRLKNHEEHEAHEGFGLNLLRQV